MLRNIKLFIVALLLLGGASCNSWLDVDLTNRVEEQELFSKADGFQKALAAVYSKMSGTSLYGYQLTYGSLEVMGQLYDYSRLPSSWENIKNLDYPNSGVRSLTGGWWSQLYSTIESLNNILEWSEKNASVMSEAQLHQIRGEALGLRAYLFFDLVRLFAPDVKQNPNAQRIPYNTEFGVKLPPLYTTQKVIELILTDLKQAEEYLKNDPIIGVKVHELLDESKDSDNKVPFRNSADKYVARMNVYAVKALMARVYLDLKDYPQAREKAQEVLQSGCFALIDRTKLTKESKPQDKDVLFSDEHIFSLRNKDIPTNAQEVCLINNKETQEVSLPLIASFKDKYDIPSLDIRWMEWFEAGDMSTHLRKYYRDKDNAKAFFPKVPLIRLSELYMIMSETYLEEDIDRAKTYADTLRIARIGKAGKLATYSENDFIAEMRREFLGEGQLFFMYKRRNHAILREGTAGDVPASEKAFVLLIPDSEIENGSVKQ